MKLLTGSSDIKVKKVMIPVVALLVLFAVAPVMAAPATKIPFTGWAGFSFVNVSPGEEWITDDGVYHVKGAVSLGNVSIHSVLGDMCVICIIIMMQVYPRESKSGFVT